MTLPMITVSVPDTDTDGFLSWGGGFPRPLFSLFHVA